MVWVIAGDGEGAIYPIGGGNFVFTYLMHLSICCFVIVVVVVVVLAVHLQTGGI